MLKDFTKETFDIIIQAGQSNACGRGFGKASKPYQATYKVWYMEQDFTFCIARELVVGNEIVSDFSLSFAEEYIRNNHLKNGRKLLILRTAVGGTCFSGGHWGLTDNLYLQMIEMAKIALDLNPANKIAAMLWHQGENDAVNNVTYEYYHEHLTKLINSVRETFGNIPFIAGNFVQDEWMNDYLESAANIIRVQREVCSAFVETDGLQSNKILGNNDTVHFCREALHQLGVRYYNAFAELEE